MPGAVGDVIKAVAQGRETDVGTIWQNVWWFRADDLADPGDQSMGVDIITRVDDLYDLVVSLFPASWILDTVRVVNQTKKLFLGTGTPAKVGTNANGDADPAQIALEVLCRSRSLGHVGRKYLGPVSEAVFVDGNLQAGPGATADVFASEWENQFTDPVTGNQYSPGTVQILPGGAPGTFRAFEDGLFETIQQARTMRSRIPGRGL